MCFGSMRWFVFFSDNLYKTDVKLMELKQKNKIIFFPTVFS